MPAKKRQPPPSAPPREEEEWKARFARLPRASKLRVIALFDMMVRKIFPDRRGKGGRKAGRTRSRRPAR
jgi:hypothetical protein